MLHGRRVFPFAGCFDYCPGPSRGVRPRSPRHGRSPPEVRGRRAKSDVSRRRDTAALGGQVRREILGLLAPAARV